VSDILGKEKDNSTVYRNDYKYYDNVLTPNSIASDYYRSKGRYDLVPINLSASDIIDYQICSPNMYQSAQCKGQFIYSRFRNVSDTFNMYANTTSKNGVASFNPSAYFTNSENVFIFNNKEYNDNFWIERFNFYKPTKSGKKDENENYIDDGYSQDLTTSITKEKKERLFDYIVEQYDNLTGSSLSPFVYFSEKDIVLYMWKKYGATTEEYAARNIVTNMMPEEGDIDIVGLYYMDGNNDFDIYTDQRKNYVPGKEGYNGYSKYSDSDQTKVLRWKWVDTHTDDNTTKTGIDTFVLDTENFYYTYTEVKTDGDGNPLLDSNGKEQTETKEVRGAIQMKNSYFIVEKIETILNRLPKTFKKSSTALKTLYADSKVQMRLNNLTNSVALNKLSSNKITANNSLIKKNVLQQSLIKANKLAARSAFDVKATKTATMNQIEPKIQAAYGFADLGKIKNLNLDGYLSMDDGSYVTTHKIGYEDNDRFRTGSSTCDSYLFLSPLNHSELQVNGDTNKSHASIKSNESLRVPIIYQYRMEDYNGHIFGNSGYKSSDAVVNNTKYANIIGIDIWLNTLSDTPKQYDIVVYSTYNKGNERKTGTVTNKIQGSIMQVNAQINSTQNDNHISL
jgi:hypothetical protein